MEITIIVDWPTEGTRGALHPLWRFLAPMGGLGQTHSHMNGNLNCIFLFPPSFPNPFTFFPKVKRIIKRTPTKKNYYLTMNNMELYKEN